MSVFDLIILAILAVLTLRGIWKGMISQIVSVAAFLVCWLVATRFGSLVAPTIPLEAPWDQVAAMAIVFLITLVAIRFGYTALEQLIRHWHLQKLNTLLGGVLGFTKGLLLCLIITFFAVMLSETSRAVVFNSQSGIHLVQLITRISLFVPGDSYEFVHAQFAQFQNQVDKAIPGQSPDALSVQSSETVQQVLAQLQRGTTEPSANSFMNALSQWWRGTEEDAPSDTEAVVFTPPAAETFTPPLPPSLPIQPANTFASTPQPAAPSPSGVQNYFARQAAPSASPLTQQLAALPPVPEIPNSQPSFSSPLTTLAPLSESAPIPPESSTQLTLALPMPPPVGSDLLLRNTGQATNPNASARVFRSQ